MPLARCRRTHALPFAAFATAALVAWGSSQALAITAEPSPRGAIAPPSAAMPGLAGADQRQGLESSAAWRTFRARHGDWRALWNAATGTPHRAVGPSIPLAGFAGDSASVDRSIRGFVAENPELFGAGVVIEPRSVRRHGALWYASYRQLVSGLEVLFADWEFRVSANGRLVLFGADAYALPPRASHRAMMAPAAARVAAVAGLDFAPGRDVAESAGPAALLPVTSAKGLDARAVLPVRVRTLQPIASWLVLVDAENGEVLMRQDQARHVTGHVTGLVHPVLPTDPLTPRPFAYQFMFADPDSATTDATGAYTVPASGPVTVRGELRGPFIDVVRSDIRPLGSGDAHYSTPAGPNDVVDLPWGSAGFSHDAERDAFYHGNIAHGHVKQLEPGFTELDYEMPLTVNYPDAHCNAVWTGVGIYFFSAGGGCVNSATTPSVLYHEYGHAVNDFVYIEDGLLSGMQNSAMHEGMADLYAAFIGDDPLVGRGFYGPGTYVRSVANTLRWPEDRVTDPHINGQMLSGGFWDLRVSLGLENADRLAHQAKHGHPDDLSDDVAFGEMFLEVLAADDDDGDLSNGTPHAAAIAHSFGTHGLGPNAWIAIDPTPVADPPAGGLVPVTARIRYLGLGVTALDASSPRLHYSLNGAPFTEVAMTPTGVADEFRASVPAPAGTIVSYFVTAQDGFGDEAVFPIAAPARRALRFVTGPAVPQLTWDMESDPGWTVGAPDDDAVTGIWVRLDPVGTWAYDTANVVMIQPADDHTPNGTQCWVTGNADTLWDPGIADVDGGKTTLTTATFDGAPAGYERPIIEYWRWYSNNTGSHTDDVWRVSISNDDGATWAPLESTAYTVNSWERQLLPIESYLTPTHTMRVRFVASDELPTSIVEAAVDDFRLLAFPAGTLSVGGAAPRVLELSAPWPNPSSGPATLTLRLPAAGHVRVALYDVGGRIVRTLVDRVLDAGAHPLVWDGRDDGGREVAAGLYFARADAGGASRLERVVRVR
jgi:hypothetical protein